MHPPSCSHEVRPLLPRGKAALTSSPPSFAPINRIHQHLHGLHCFATGPSSLPPLLPPLTSADRTRLVSAHHFCSCAPNSGVRQCIIYDSAAPDARLIGIEYIVTEEVFVALPEEEKKYWHSRESFKRGGREGAEEAQTSMRSRVGCLSSLARRLFLLRRRTWPSSRR